MNLRLITFLVVLVLGLVSLPSCPTLPPAVRSHVSSLGLTPAFDGARFQRPVLLAQVPGTESLLVVEQRGLVYRMADSQGAKKAVFLDIRKRVSRRGNEEGLLGLAFHPDFQENGQVFVHYSASGPRRGVISRFTMGAQGLALDEDSEFVLLEQEQPFSNHNGGSIAFGPDGFLYISFGDGGSAGDPGNRSQNLGSLLGKILRIDVNQHVNGLNYRIHDDNQFVSTSGARGEIWALGLRNTWRFSFDSPTGRLWGGDVGQWSVEEINIITQGGNFGWKRFEGNKSFSSAQLTTNPAIPPVSTYGRKDGFSVTGGFVYRGREIPMLQGVYVFADYASGRIWGLWPRDDGKFERRILLDSYMPISSFGEDSSRELFVCNHDGPIFKLTWSRSEKPVAESFPQFITAAPFFKRKDHWMAYDVVSPLWSDGLEKSRFLLLEEGTKIRQVKDRFLLPSGAYLIKNFSCRQGGKLRLVETRVIVKDGDKFDAVSYFWNDEQTEAERCDEVKRFQWQGEVGKRSWLIPNPNQCRQCHTDAGGFAIGFQPNQLIMNGEFKRLRKTKDIFMAPTRTRGIKSLIAPLDGDGDVALRARSYLDANCAHCHQPGGLGNSPIDLRMATPLNRAHMLNREANHGVFGLADSKIVVPGSGEKSVLLQRMNTRGIGHMPPLGSSIVDREAVDLIRGWIQGM